MFVFHKSKNFTSSYEIQISPPVPLNHYCRLILYKPIKIKTTVLFHYPMLNYSKGLNANIMFTPCFEHSNFFKVKWENNDARRRH